MIWRSHKPGYVLKTEQSACGALVTTDQREDNDELTSGEEAKKLRLLGDKC
jgi:hypothetical protein